MLKVRAIIIRMAGGFCCKRITKNGVSFISCVIFLAWAAQTIQAQTVWPQVAHSKDGTQISYEIHGVGEPTLIFIHGWSCDARYWRMQIPHFSKKHRVIVLDLAGHGHSAMTRKRYTMRSFGEDVRAVADAAGGGRVILIGHSMGGSVIVEAAKLMPKSVKGLIGVDTLENIEYPMTRQDLEKMTAPMKKNFQTASREFIGQMIYPGTDPKLRDWILSDVSAAPSAVALSAMSEMMTQYITGEAAKAFEKVRVPVVCVNGDLWPIDYEANRRHMLSFDAIILPKADHFLMMNQPDAFNLALEKAIWMLSEKDAK